MNVQYSSGAGTSIQFPSGSSSQYTAIGSGLGYESPGGTPFDEANLSPPKFPPTFGRTRFEVPMPVPAARWTTRDTPRESVPPVLFGIGDVSGIPIGQPGLFARMQGAHDRVFEKTGLSSIRVVLTWFDGTQVEKAVNLIVKGLPVTREQLANQVSKLVGDFVLHKVVRDESPPELYLVALDPVQADIFRVEMHATLF